MKNNHKDSQGLSLLHVMATVLTSISFIWNKFGQGKKEHKSFLQKILLTDM